MKLFSRHPILLFGIVLAIPLASSCLRTTNNAGGDFLPDPRSSAKTFPTTHPTPIKNGGGKSGEKSGEKGGNDSGEQETSTLSSTSSSTSASSTTTEKSRHSGEHGHHGGHHHHHNKWSHSHSQEERFRKHMQQYRNLFFARNYQAKTFTSKGEAGGDTRLTRRNESESSGGVSLHKPNSEEKKETKPVFESKDGAPTMCSTCPKIMITTTDQLKKQCENWKSINDNFFMKMDSDEPEIKEKYTFSECFKTVKCKEPHAIIRWLDYSMCDIHNSSKDEPDFELKCNGTYWTMHGFPVDAVTCAKRHRL